MIHLRIPYYRPSWHGGDVEHPLCLMPITGWAGPHAARVEMSDDLRRVSCPHCRAFFAAGGIKARHAWLLEHLGNWDNPERVPSRERRAA